MGSMSWTARTVAWTALVGLLVAIAYGSRLSEGKPPANALYQYETAVGGIAIYLILLAVVLWIGRGLPRRDFLALRRPASWGRALGLALGGYVAIFIGAGLLIVLLDAGDEQGLTPDEWDSSRLGPYVANFVAIAIVGPIVEELTYRGAGMTLFLRHGSAVAVVVTALGFGLGHGLVVALPALVFFGLVTAFLRLRTDSVYPSMLVHCAFNATSLILAVTT
jgi:membrane protease YdiL (CAAX protease family)